MEGQVIENALPIMIDIVIVFFDLLIFMRMVALKKDTLVTRGIMYVGCTLILVVYFVATYVYLIPSSISALCCMGLPSLLLFFCLAKYKDSRFFLTFSIMDTTTLAFGCVMRWFADMTGDALALIATTVILGTIYVVCRPYFEKYHELQAAVTKGWRSMAFTSCLIYVVMIFVAAYPKPLAQRPEYNIPYLVLCVMVLACYYVFIQSIMKMQVIYHQNQQLLQEKKFHRIAYTDMLTELKNRAAYMERVEELERDMTPDQAIGVLFFDMNRFKQINDNYGHDIGDKVLIHFGNILTTVFEEDQHDVYRIGGDEFVVLTSCTHESCLNNLIDQVNRQLEQSKAFEFPITVAAGMAILSKNSGESIAEALRRADLEMYRHKSDVQG